MCCRATPATKYDGALNYSGPTFVAKPVTPVDLPNASLLRRTAALIYDLFLIVALSIVLGAALPIFLEKLNAGASNAATTIQVVMDVSGVLITCAVCGYLLDGTSPLSVLLPGVAG